MLVNGPTNRRPRPRQTRAAGSGGSSFQDTIKRASKVTARIRSGKKAANFIVSRMVPQSDPSTTRHRRARLHRLLPQSSSASRVTPGAFGFLTLSPFRPSPLSPRNHPALRCSRSLHNLRSLRRLLRTLRSLGELRSLGDRVFSWQVVSGEDVLRRFRAQRHRKSTN